MIASAVATFRTDLRELYEQDEFYYLSLLIWAIDARLSLSGNPPMVCKSKKKKAQKSRVN